jgi:hypothetical protein
MEGSKLGRPWNVPCLVAFEMNPMLGGQWKNILLGVQWKVLRLVALGRFQAWWPLEGSKLGGLWNVPYLVAFGRRRRRKNIIFTSFHFSPIRFYLNIFFH